MRTHCFNHRNSLAITIYKTDNIYTHKTTNYFDDSHSDSLPGFWIYAPPQHACVDVVRYLLAIINKVDFKTWMQNQPYLAIVEHSMCHPGRPRPLPQGDAHHGSPGLAAFHSAKSRGFFFSLSARREHGTILRLQKSCRLLVKDVYQRKITTVSCSYHIAQQS
jgi:transposase InsO family protein